MEKWFQGQLEKNSYGKEKVKYLQSYIPQPAVIKSLQSGLEKHGLPVQLRKPIRPTLNVSDKVQADVERPLVFQAMDRHHSIMPCPYGLAEIRTLVRGEEIIVGVATDVKKTGMKAVIDELGLSTGAGLIALANQEKNFCIRLKPWHTAYLPAGFVYIIFRIQESMGLK
eukprot:6717586-Pyramimonas_sp.AAC.1